MARVLAADERGIAEARRLLAAGDVIAFPTETFYGLAADARSESAVEKVFAAKRRPADAPVALIAADFAAAASLAGARALPASFELLARAFWPGALTLVIPASEAVPVALTAGTKTIGVRVSPHPVASALAAAFPITATSANVSGTPPVRLASRVAAELPDVPLVLDGGETPGGLASTVVDLASTPPRIVRPGVIGADALRAVVRDLAG